MINKDTLITPALSDGILESITRVTVISLASELDIKTETRSINRTELMLANELFLCGSAAEITPICILDGRKVGMGCRGRITRQLTQLYFETVNYFYKFKRDIEFGYHRQHFCGVPIFFLQNKAFVFKTLCDNNYVLRL